MKKLAGVIFLYNCESQDYCYKQAIKCLLAFCDQVYVLDAGSIDGTQKGMFVDGNVTYIMLNGEEWASQNGKEKLSYFTNKAIEIAEADGYEYIFSLQADEILHEKSYKAVREAVEKGCEGYAVSRINLWGSPYHQLKVPQERKPCSTTIFRLAKAKYRAYGDAESLAVDNPSIDFHDEIKIYHMGFVRKREVMVSKIKHMQEKVFGMSEADPKLRGMMIFDPWAWFDKEEDLELINEPLPEIIKGWADARVYSN